MTSDTAEHYVNLDAAEAAEREVTEEIMAEEINREERADIAREEEFGSDQIR